MGLLDTLFGRTPTVDNRQEGPLAAWCAEHGWSYQRRNDGFADAFTGLPGFRTNNGRQAWHVMRGRHRERSVAAFQYNYLTTTDNRGRRNAYRHAYQVVSVRTPASTPTLTVTREPWDSKFDLDLDDAEFNDNFKIKIDDRSSAFAVQVLHGGMMRRLLDDERTMRLKWPFRFEEGNLYSWQPWAPAPEPQSILEGVDFLVDILEHIPAEVWER